MNDNHKTMVREKASQVNGIDTMRHSCAHVMAAAISDIWPEAQFGVGPSTSTGFYYDVLFPSPIGKEDLSQIERAMRLIQRQSLPFERVIRPIGEAIDLSEVTGQYFKKELLELLRDKGSTAIATETGDDHVVNAEAINEVSYYALGGFEDLCRGPHVENSKKIGYFKLTNLAGAYWRGDEKREQLQRIYGICYQTKRDLNDEITRLEEMKLRDHRRLGREMKIFHLSPEVGAGLPLWLPNGTVMRDELEHLAKEYERAEGYERVSTPHITNEDLYYKSGHLPYYKDDMYDPIQIGNKKYYLKPMNCPHHHHIYLSTPRSYRDLPLRLAEYGQVYRYEDSGALSGIIRTRGFCQNDAHIYCDIESAKDEFMRVMEMHVSFYELFDISDFYMRLSLPDLDNLEKYVDNPNAWRAALEIIVEAMIESGLRYVEAKGEAAFYGPKVDFMIKSAIGTEYAISTNQLDFLSSIRFGLTYKGSDGQDHPVYVIHRAPLGSHERFIAFLLEHYGATFPIWLAPVQAVIVPVSDKFYSYATSIHEAYCSQKVRNGSLGLRVHVDRSSERMQKKIRNALHSKIPLILVVGADEEENSTVSVRTREGVNYGPIKADHFLHLLTDVSESRDDQLLYDVLPTRK